MVLEGTGEAGTVRDLRESAGVVVVVEEEEEEAMERLSAPGAAKGTERESLRGRWRGVVGRPWIWS